MNTATRPAISNFRSKLSNVINWHGFWRFIRISIFSNKADWKFHMKNIIYLLVEIRPKQPQYTVPQTCFYVPWCEYRSFFRNRKLVELLYFVDLKTISSACITFSYTKSIEKAGPLLGRSNINETWELTLFVHDDNIQTTSPNMMNALLRQWWA